MKLTRADIEFANAIKDRDGWQCRKCGKQYQPGDRGLHCAHIIPRGHKDLRFDPMNALALCYRDHLFWAHSHPLEFADWIREELGAKAYNDPRRRARTLSKSVKS